MYFGNAYAEQRGVCFSTKSAAKLGTVAQCSGQLRNHALSPTAQRYSEARRNRSALPITETELKLIAAAAIIGLSNSPKNGYRIPAAIGTSRWC